MQQINKRLFDAKIFICYLIELSEDAFYCDCIHDKISDVYETQRCFLLKDLSAKVDFSFVNEKDLYQIFHGLKWFNIILHFLWESNI